MALGIADLINNVTGSINGLITDLLGGGNDLTPYPRDADYKAIQSQINQKNWNKLSFPYTFAVVSLSNAGDNGGFKDFSLPLAPENINQREQPAINVKPTQGGTTVNHNGNRYKTLSIAGTTGIAPFRGTGGVQASTGEAIFQPKELKYKSGFEVFHLLRNWFRTYYEFKHKQGDSAKDYRILFKNYKDGEFLIVELESFEMDRQSARSFLYDYKIELKVLAHYQFQVQSSSALESFENALENAFEKIDQARGIFLRTQGILRQVESTYENVVLGPLRKATLAIKALKGISTVAADVSSQAIKNTVSTTDALAITLGIQKQQIDNLTSGTLDPRIAGIKIPSDPAQILASQGSTFLTSFGEGLMALPSTVFPPKTLDQLQNDMQAALTQPRNFYTDSIDGLVRVRQNAEDFFNLGSTSYDALLGRTRTLAPNPGQIVTNDQYDLLYAFSLALEGIYLLLSTTDLFRATFSERIADMNSRFDDAISLRSSQAVKKMLLPGFISIERLAQQQLGDSERWGEIAELNNLIYPYFVEDASQAKPGVLKAGDAILIPAPVRNGFSQLPDGVSNKLTQNMDELEKSLGCDFLLSKDNDLVLSNANDLEIVAGPDNLGQAVILKLSYEPGELLKYPALGAGILIGRKFPALEDIKDNLLNTLLQDPRINKIENLSLKQDNSALSLNFDLYIRQVDIPVPVSIRI